MDAEWWGTDRRLFDMAGSKDPERTGQYSAVIARIGRFSAPRLFSLQTHTKKPGRRDWPGRKGGWFRNQAACACSRPTLSWRAISAT